MNHETNETIKARMVRLHLARNELEKGCMYILVSVLIYYAVNNIADQFEDFYFNIRFGTFHITLDGAHFIPFLVFFIVVCSFDFLRMILKYRDVLLVKHSEVGNSRCTCRKKSTLLMFASHDTKTIGYGPEKIVISCLHCRGMIYHCDTVAKKENNDFPLNTR